MLPPASPLGDAATEPARTAAGDGAVTQPTGDGPGIGAPAERGAGSRLWAVATNLFERDALILGLLLILAALTRLPGLAGRGDFDGDQGHDMLTLLHFVRDGQIPLLGPPTSIGEFHHGAAYYYLLAPFAWLSGSNPMAVLAGIAAFGIAAVGVTWWLARAIGGRAAGAIAGLLLAVSPAAIEESTFIWNPNPIPFFAVLALAAAWHARTTGGARWWALAMASAGMVVQLHVLGIVFLPPILAFGVLAARRAARDGDSQRQSAVIRGLAGGIGLVVVLFVPLLIHELQTGFLETHRLVAYFSAAGGGSAGALDPFGRLLFAGLRIIGWPLVGLVTSAPIAAVLIVSMTFVLGLWLMVTGRGDERLAAPGRGDERLAARWLGFTVAWSAISLAVLAPSLQTVIAGLPNDHYHAFLDPVVVILIALTMRAMGAGPGLRTGADRVARMVMTTLLVGLVLVEIGRWPPQTQANGGWPMARDAGARITAAFPGATFDVRGVPVFKSAEGIGFPIVLAGGTAMIATGEESSGRPVVPGSVLVIVCDRLFEQVMGEPCGGVAEEQFLGQLVVSGAAPAGMSLADRFDASDRTSVSVYRR
ncbi:MAG: glycosyltransferase family 39 protein [Chloroflexota bacterium]